MRWGRGRRCLGATSASSCSRPSSWSARLSDGCSSQEAAAILSISVRTADTHRASLMRKLDARNLADVVKYCIRNGLVGT